MSPPDYAVGDPAPRPPRLRSESEVMKQWVGEAPVVSILCPTFQHVEFIEDAIHGFLGQDTVFPFEILIRDDASTDGTADIVRDYAQRYPRIVRLILEVVNRWPATSPLHELHARSRGRFVAICEGDDYWTDPTKIARQVEMLLQDEHAVASHHDAIVVADGRIANLHEVPASRRRDIERSELILSPYLPIRTLMVRREALDFLDDVVRRSWYVNNLDQFLTAHLGLSGRCRYLSGEGIAVYRRHEGGLESGYERTTRKGRSGMTSFWIAVHLKENGFESASQKHLVRATEKFAHSELVDRRNPELWLGLMLIRAFLAKRLGALRARLGRLRG